MSFQNPFSVCCDWLSVTIPWASIWKGRAGEEFIVREWVAAIFGEENEWHADKALHGYKRGWIHRQLSGWRLLESEPDDRMGIHLQWSGRALQERETVPLVETAQMLRAAFTRIDLAIDVWKDAPPVQFYRALLDGQITTPATKRAFITSDTGETVYLGSRTSERFLRVYDKAAQLGIPGAWTRIELELKGRHAQHAAEVLLYRGLEAVPSFIRAFADCTTPKWFSDAVRASKVDIGIPQARKETDTRKWLLEVVAGALAREAWEEWDFLGTFYEAVERAMENLPPKDI